MSDSIPQKRCPKCKQTLPITSFSRTSRNKDGLQSHCKDCCNAYAKQRYELHKEELLENNRKYLEAHREENRERCRQYYHSHREQMLAYQKQHQQENREHYIEYKKRYYETNKEALAEQLKQYGREHREHRREYHRQHYLLHSDKIRKKNKEYQRSPKGRMVDSAAHHKRRILKQSAGDAFTAQDIADQLKRQRNRCYYCSNKLGKGPRAYHADHIIPLSRGGSNGPDNIVIACPTCNLSKHNKLLSEWPEGGRLF